LVGRLPSASATAAAPPSHLANLLMFDCPS
jgi:hypothetical protein